MNSNVTTTATSIATTGTTPPCWLVTVPVLATIYGDAKETEPGIRANIFKAEDRLNSRGERIAGNGLAAHGARRNCPTRSKGADRCSPLRQLARWTSAGQRLRGSAMTTTPTKEKPVVRTGSSDFSNNDQLDFIGRALATQFIPANGSVE